MSEYFPGIYLERGVPAAGQLVEKLARPPENPLNPQELKAAIQYENTLFDTPISTEEGAPTIGDVLRDTQGEATAAPIFFAKPFMDGKMDSMCKEITRTANSRGYAIIPPTFDSPAAVYEWFARLAGRGSPSDDERPVRSKTLRDIAMKSLIAYKHELGAELAQGKAAEDIDPLIAEGRPIVVNAEQMLDQHEKLARVRSILVHEYRDLRQGRRLAVDRLHQFEESHCDVSNEGSNMSQRMSLGREIVNLEARQAILDVYMAKVNSQVASGLPCLRYLYEQARLLGDTELAEDALRRTPGAIRAALQDQHKSHELFLRLDHLKNGVSFDENADATPVEQRLWELARLPQAPVPTASRPQFTLEERRKLRAYLLSSAQILDIAKKVMAARDMLSSEDASTYSAEDSRPTADGKWRPVVNSRKDSFTVSSLARTFEVPESPQPLDHVLVVGFKHEIGHCDQGDIDALIGKSLKIANLKGRRVSLLRESGAKEDERRAEIKLFGVSSSNRPRMTYARAVLAMREGQGPIRAAKEFFDALQEDAPDADAADAGTKAADRVVRLMRFAGTNSQPLTYAEEFLLAEELTGVSDAAVQRLRKITCFDLRDQERLHRYGLLPLPESTNSRPDALELALKAARPYIDEALQRP